MLSVQLGLPIDTQIMHARNRSITVKMADQSALSRYVDMGVTGNVNTPTRKNRAAALTYIRLQIITPRYIPIHPSDTIS